MVAFTAPIDGLGFCEPIFFRPVKKATRLPAGTGDYSLINIVGLRCANPTYSEP